MWPRCSASGAGSRPATPAARARRRDSIARCCRSRSPSRRPTRNSTRATPSRRRGSRSRRPAGAPNVVIVLIDDIGFGGPSTFGGPIRTPTMDQLAAGRPALQQLPHDGAVLADAQSRSRPAGTTTPSTPARSWRRSTAFPGNTGQNPEQRGAAGGDAAAQRLQHRRLRQVARDGRLGDQRVGPVRSLAHAPGLRQVLRLHRRRDRPVVSAHLRRRDQGRSAEDGELPLHRRHDQPGHQLGEGAAVDDAGQAVLRLLRDRRDACAAPRAEGVGRQVQGPVRQGLGPGPRSKRSSGRRSWA